MDVNTNYFTTSDGVKLFYRISGTGSPLILLSGYGQDTTGFSRNYEELGKHFTVYTFDYRAHGLSDTPEYGYHIERLAKDFYEFMEHVELDKIFLLAHSMGNAVAWCYFSIFGQDKIMKYILGDEAPCLICDPAWTEEEKEMYTGKFQKKDIWEPLTPRRGVFEHEQSEPTLRDKMLTRLLRDHLSRDWRDIIPTIKIPTMILMGGASHFASPLLWNWLQDNIKDSELQVISAEENGTHGMHSANPEKFNELVANFLLS